MSMTFDTSFKDNSKDKDKDTSSSSHPVQSTPNAWDSPSRSHKPAWGDSPDLSRKTAWDDSPPPTAATASAASAVSWESQTNDAPGRPPLRSASTMPASNPGYNAWADEFEEEEFGPEKEVKMTFM